LLSTHFHPAEASEFRGGSGKVSDRMGFGVARTRGFIIVAAAGMILFAACGGTTNPSAGNQNSSGGAGGRSGSGGATGGDGSAGNGACPTDPPAAGNACTPPWTINGTTSPPLAHCSWGEDPRPQCRVRGTCVDGKWQISPADQLPCAAVPLPASCLAAPPVNTTPCSDATLACWYDDGTRCACSDCQSGSEFPICKTIDPPEWFCDQPEPNCPIILPQAGEPCGTEGLSCGRGCDLVVQCHSGVWQWTRGVCPICAAPDTPIATPAGDKPIAALAVGDLVYSVDHDAIIAVPIIRTGRTLVRSHHVVRVELSDGSVLEMSPGHRIGSGLAFGDLKAGIVIDAQRIVVSAELVPYAYRATYDILPASSSGNYYAAGVLIASTLVDSGPAFATSTAGAAGSAR
jgi:hypothetical protein